MLQFYIPEVVSVEQIFDEADEMQVNIRLGSVKTLTKGSRTKKKLADFETFAQIWVGGSGKNLI